MTGSDRTVELTPDTAESYLRTRDEVDGRIRAIEPLGGGVSNAVLRIETDAGRLVCKQPFPNLDVEDDWPADVARVHNEAAATEAYADAIDRTGIADVRVPRVLFEDRDAHVVGIECVPEAATTWKSSLLEGRVDADVARSLGRLLGAVHRIAAGDATLAAAFDDPTPFEQLRLDPYHRTVARRHPELSETVRAEVDRIESVGETLVHGDYSPKNVLVDDESGTSWVLDFEVAHWGDPAFDVAFMCNHLLLKSLYDADRGAAYVGALEAFWRAYRSESGWDREEDVAAELGVLLLARIDGKSPVEYVESDRLANAVRSVGRTVLREDVRTLAGVLEVAAAERDRL